MYCIELIILLLYHLNLNLSWVMTTILRSK